MKTPVWQVPDDGEVQLPASSTAEAGLVSMPFLAAAVRRRWRRIAVTAAVCAILAVGLAQVMGHQHAATVTLLLTSDPGTDPSAAMITNQSLVRTRTVSRDVVENLGLPLTPEAFGNTVTATPASNQLLVLEVTAPSDQAALRRVDELAKVYLKFRAKQLSAFATSTINANQKRIDSLTGQIAGLTKRYDLVASSPGQEQLATTLLTQRAQLQSALDDAEQANAQTKMENEAVIAASHVVDTSALVPTSRSKTYVLAFLSGLVGGTVLGLGLVLTPAVLSTRLRRREDVARALGLPVRFSAGAVTTRGWRVSRREARRSAERLAHGLATALPQDATLARLTLATVGDVRDGAFVIGALADGLARESTAVAVVDLSSSGVLAKRRRRLLGAPDPLANRQLVKVHRRDVRVSELGSRNRVRAGSDKELGKAEVVLTLIELDLGAGVDALGKLADSCVVLVSTGRASAERLRSSATLLRQSGIQPAFAMLAGADDTDDSSGLLEAAGTRNTPTRRLS